MPDRTALLQAILYDLRLPYADRGEQVLRLRLTEQLLKNCADDQRTLLIVDEAHHLSADLLEELRLLTNLEAGSRKTLQVVLIAQPSIAETLKQPALAALQQRLAVRCRLETLGVEERMRRLLIYVQRGIGVVKAQQEIQSQVQEKLGELQTHLYSEWLRDASRSGVVTAEEAERFMADLRERDAAGLYFAYMPHFRITATRPAE